VTGSPGNRIAIVGLGAIGSAVARSFEGMSAGPVVLSAVCVRPEHSRAALAELSPGVRIVTEPSALLATEPHTVVEAAGHRFLREWGAVFLEKGVDIVLLSVGALADERLRDAMVSAARAGGARIRIPAGALGAFDSLLALRESGLHSVRYTSTKPARSWRGTPAERAHDLDALTDEVIVFRGSAGEAARLYPRNANLAAAVALAGIGFERTEVVLIADPKADEIQGALEAQGVGSSLYLRIAGIAAATNPTTSAVVAASVISSLLNGAAPIQFG